MGQYSDPPPTGLNSVLQSHLHAREARERGLAMCQGQKKIGLVDYEPVSDYKCTLNFHPKNKKNKHQKNLNFSFKQSNLVWLFQGFQFSKPCEPQFLFLLDGICPFIGDSIKEVTENMEIKGRAENLCNLVLRSMWANLIC